MHIITELYQNKIFEFKSPNKKPFYQKGKDTRFYITKDLAQGLNQLVIYMKKANVYAQLLEPGTYKEAANALGFIVIGYDLSRDELDLLSFWNFHLRPHIRIITYNELITSAKQQLINIQHAREIIKNKQ